ncbi:MAG TPA: putative glycoside hydrolase [Gaiellaceae bacterium]|nr:putative glycoside hydrolase [Gaiellaceae bacterium]
MLLGLVVVAAAAVALGMSFLTGRGGEPVAAGDASGGPAGTSGTTTAPAPPEPAPLPSEIRGVHVTMALASIPGKLGEYLSLTGAGLTALQLDVKDENGEVAFRRPAVPLARAAGAARTYYDPRRAARRAEARGVYLIGRVVVFEDPVLSRTRPQLAIGRRGGGIWTTSGGLGWTNPYDERVWKYNVDVAAAAVEAGFDEIMFDYVRFPTDGDLASAVFPGRRKEPKAVTIGRFLEYARDRLEPLGARVSAAVFGLSAARNMGIGQQPGRLARHLDLIYPMVYPSHYGPGEYDLDDPNAVPGITVARSLRDFRRALAGGETLLVPWLQDFSLGREYTLEDVKAQILAARDAKARGFLLWNPAGVYTDGALAPP